MPVDGLVLVAVDFLNEPVANTRLGLYKQSNGDVVNYLLSPTILAIRKGDRPGLANPLVYYLR